MSDIVKRLREEPHRVSPGLVLEAAAEIERLRAALREIAAVPTCPGAERERLIMIAREALQ